MADDAIGYATLQVIPSMRGTTNSLEKEFGGLFGGLGKKAGKQLGSDVADGMRSSKAEVEKAAKVLTDATEKAAAAQGKVADAAGKVRVAEAKLEELREKGKATKSQIAAAEERYAKSLRDSGTASKAAEKAAKAVEQARKAAADAAGKGSEDGAASGEKFGGSFLEGVKGKLSNLTGAGGKGGLIGGTIGAALSLAGLSGAGLFAAALQSGLQRQQALDLTQARLGVDDATMAKIGTAAGRAYVSTFGESVAANADTARVAIQSGLLDKDATAQETQAVIEQLSGVSEIMGEEIPAVARAAGQAVKTGMADNATDAMDLFVASSQSGLNVSEDLLDTVTEYGTQFRKLGIDGPEAMGLINQAVKGGARDSDVAADAIKEFAIRAVDGSDSTTKAFEQLNLSADEISGKFAEGGTAAHDATQQIFDGLRNIQDPLVRGQVAVALFGTQWEDLGGAFDKFDLSTAAASLGQVGGAAETALNKISGNAASSIEGAKRSIEQSTDAISSALAKAFGPELAKVADWVTEHQPEILGFFGKLVDGVFAAGDAILGMTSTGLRAFASFADGAGQSIAAVVKPLGLVTEVFGKLTGSKSMETLGKGLSNLDVAFGKASSTARSLADGIDDSARPALDRLRGSVGDSIASAQQSELMFRALGDTVATLPDGHTIVIQDNSPETQARLAELGLKIEQIPGTKDFKVVANTAEGQGIIDSFVQANTGRKIPMTAEVALGAITGDPAAVAQVQQQVGGTNALWPDTKADGGISRGAQISSRPVLWAEAGPEAYIPLSPGKRDKSVPIWVEVGRRLGLLTAMAAGGIIPGKSFARSMEGVPYEMGGFSRSSIDCSGMVSAGVNAAFGRSAFDGRMSTVTEGDWLASMGAESGLGAVGSGDISVGWYDNGGGPNGHTAMTLGDGTNVESRAGDGVVVGSAARGANDPMFDHQMHFPEALLQGGDLGKGSTAPSSGSTPGGTGGTPSGTGASGLGLGASTGGSSGASSGGGGGSTGGGNPLTGGSRLPIGASIPVWVDNMPATGFGGGGTGVGGSSLTGGGATPAGPSAIQATDVPGAAGVERLDTGPVQPSEPQDHPLKGLPLTGELFNGQMPWYVASSPEQALANLGVQAGQLSQRTASDVLGYFTNGDNLKEMLGTAIGVAGMGAVGGGGAPQMVVNNTGMDPKSAAQAVERVWRRRTLATQRSGGFGR